MTLTDLKTLITLSRFGGHARLPMRDLHGCLHAIELLLLDEAPEGVAGIHPPEQHLLRTRQLPTALTHTFQHPSSLLKPQGAQAVQSKLALSQILHGLEAVILTLAEAIALNGDQDVWESICPLGDSNGIFDVVQACDYAYATLGSDSLLPMGVSCRVKILGHNLRNSASYAALPRQT